MVVCPRCGAVMHHDEDQRPEDRITHHMAVGACRPPKQEKPAPKAKKPTAPSIKSTLGGGWDL